MSGKKLEDAMPTEAELAAARERNLERRRHHKATASMHGTENRVVGANATHATKVNRIIKKILDRFTEECEGGHVLGNEINWIASDSLRVRREQLSTIKDYIAVVRQLKELHEMLLDEESKGVKKNPLSKENVVLLERAEELLKKAG